LVLSTRFSCVKLLFDSPVVVVDVLLSPILCTLSYTSSSAAILFLLITRMQDLENSKPLLPISALLFPRLCAKSVMTYLDSRPYYMLPLNTMSRHRRKAHIDSRRLRWDHSLLSPRLHSSSSSIDNISVHSVCCTVVQVSVRHTAQGPEAATPAPGPIGPLGPGGPRFCDRGEDDVMGDATAMVATTAPTTAMMRRMSTITGIWQ
jgi:hypothetical protein